MKASAKSTELNAYVTGFGASKRVVVWDTTVAKSTPDEIAFIFAHEMGHYALGHVVLGVGAVVRWRCCRSSGWAITGCGCCCGDTGRRGGFRRSRTGRRWWCWCWCCSRCRTLSDPIHEWRQPHGSSTTPMCMGRRPCMGSWPTRRRWGCSRSRCWGRIRWMIRRRTRCSNGGSTPIRRRGSGRRLPRCTIRGLRASSPKYFAK